MAHCPPTPFARSHHPPPSTLTRMRLCPTRMPDCLPLQMAMHRDTSPTMTARAHGGIHATARCYSLGGASASANPSAARESVTHNGDSSRLVPSLLARISDDPIHSAGDARATNDDGFETVPPTHIYSTPKLSAREIMVRTRPRLPEHVSREVFYFLQPESDLSPGAAHAHQQEVSVGSGLEGSANEGLRTPTFATTSDASAPSLSSASRGPSSSLALSPNPTAPSSSPSRSEADLRTRLLNKLEDERRQSETQVAFADQPTASRAVIDGDSHNHNHYYVDPSSVPPVPMAEERERRHEQRSRQRGRLTSEQQLHQVESRLRTQAQLRARLAAERRLADVELTHGKEEK
ncbi:hypothetical protein OF83DRAFT_527212 [Amylostereum chailletii]|nr:hypothetical protein OF83DRAFT_527212 [Amylostereum chailletii]